MSETNGKSERKIYIGNVNARATSMTPRRVGQKETPSVLVQFATSPDQKARVHETNEREEVPEGWSFAWDGWLTDAQSGDVLQWERTLETLRTCGWKGKTISDLSKTDGLGDCEVSLNLQATSYKTTDPETREEVTKWRQEVRFVNPLGGRGGFQVKEETKMSAADLAALDARFSKKSGTGGRSQAPVKSPSNVDDTIPF